MEYTWDENKRKSNISKHGWDFREAHKFFEQGPYFEDCDDESGEERWTAIGKIDGKPVFMVYRELEVERRIISLRSADVQENKSFELELSQSVGQEDNLTKLLDSTKIEREQGLKTPAPMDLFAKDSVDKNIIETDS